MLNSEGKPKHIFAKQSSERLDQIFFKLILSISPQSQEMYQLVRQVLYLDAFNYQSEVLDEILEWWFQKIDKATPEERA